MSVDVTSYVVYGVKLDKYPEEMVNDVWEADENDLIIADGMMGCYVVLGKILHRANANGGEEFTQLDTYKLSKYEADYKEEFKTKFPQHYHYIEGKPFELIAFNHYS